MVASGIPGRHRLLRDRLVVFLVVTIVVDLVCAHLAWLFERHAPDTEIHNIGDALFWTSAQLLTVSSSMKNPLTTGGRILDVVMEIYAITLVTAMAGSFAHFFHLGGSPKRT